MKKLILSLFLVLSSFVLGQSTVVSFQVTDTPDNQTWNSGSWTVQLQPLTGNITNTNFTIIGSATPVPNLIQSGTLSGSGAGSVTLTPNSVINPIGSQWNFTVCPQASTTCFSKLIFVFGTTQSITIAPPSVRINGLRMILAYTDAEVSTGIGQLYYNLSSNNLRVCTQVICNGSGFSAIAGGGGSGCIANPADGGCALLGNPSIDQFIGSSVGAGTGWLLQLLANAFNINVPVNITAGSTAGVWSIGCGPDPGVGSGIAFTGPVTCVPYTVYMPSNGVSGFWRGTNTANKVTMNFQNGIDAGNDLFNAVPVANGGTGNTTPSGALVALFPNFTRNGDLCCFWNGSAWVPLAGCTSAGGTVNFITENSGGSWSCTTSPLGTPVGGSGLSTRTLGRIYEGNTTGAEIPSSFIESTTLMDSSKPLSFNGVGAYSIIFTTPSASTNAAIGAVTMDTAGSSGNLYRFTAYVDQTVAGVGCSTNTTLTLILNWSDPANAGTNTAGLLGITIANNGTAGIMLNSVGVSSQLIRAKASTTISYNVTFTGGTCATSLPFYQVYPLLEKIN